MHPAAAVVVDDRPASAPSPAGPVDRAPGSRPAGPGDRRGPRPARPRSRSAATAAFISARSSLRVGVRRSARRRRAPSIRSMTTLACGSSGIQFPPDGRRRQPRAAGPPAPAAPGRDARSRASRSGVELGERPAARRRPARTPGRTRSPPVPRGSSAITPSTTPSATSSRAVGPREHDRRCGTARCATRAGPRPSRRAASSTLSA